MPELGGSKELRGATWSIGVWVRSKGVKGWYCGIGMRYDGEEAEAWVVILLPASGGQFRGSTQVATDTDTQLSSLFPP